MNSKTKLFYRVLAVVLCLATLFVPVLADEAPVRGDCNGDAAINMKDVLTLRKVIAGLLPGFAPHDCGGVDGSLVRGDCNADDAVNMKDVLTLRQFVAGMMEALPAHSCNGTSNTSVTATQATAATASAATETAASSTATGAKTTAVPTATKTQPLPPGPLSEERLITVLGGSANTETASPGDTVFLTADIPAEGMEFDCWTVTAGNAVLDDSHSELATFVMPDEDVTVEASYRKVIYTVYVTGGTASEEHPEVGDTVTVTAGKPHAGERFDRWVVSGVEIADVSAETLTFAMPQGNVTLMATYCEL